MGSLWIIITAFEVISRNPPKLGETGCAKLTMLNIPPPLYSNIFELTIFFNHSVQSACALYLHCPIAYPMGGIIHPICEQKARA